MEASSWRWTGVGHAMKPLPDGLEVLHVVGDSHFIPKDDIEDHTHNCEDHTDNGQYGVHSKQRDGDA